MIAFESRGRGSQWSAWPVAIALAAFVATAACAKETATSRVAAADGPRECVAVDSTVARSGPRGGENPDSLRRVIEALSRQIASASNDALPALLLDAGRAKTKFSPPSFLPSPDPVNAAYAKARPKDFETHEPDAVWMYTGADFEDLIRRFPSSDLADDAGYGETLLLRAGECEGSTLCEVRWMLGPVASFLMRFPASPLGDSAADRAIDAFRPVDDLDDPRRASGDDDDPGAVRSEIRLLDTLARLPLVPAPRAARLLAKAGELWERFADYDLARADYRAAIALAVTPLGSCVAARLAALPVRSFVLDTAHVIHAHRVDLSWQPPVEPASAYEIYRSSSYMDRGLLVTRLSGSARAWSDTAATPGAKQWYRVVATTTGGVAQSNPSFAGTPDLRVRVEALSVSPTDGTLYLFGQLSNRFPQVIAVSADGATVRRFDAAYVGPSDNGDIEHTLDRYVDALWLVDANKHGVMRLAKPRGGLPDSTGVRRGTGALRGSLALSGDAFCISVDERGPSAWVEIGHGGIWPFSMDCIASSGVCWWGFEKTVELRTDAGRVLVTVPLPHAEVKSTASYPTAARAVYADPSDTSVWIWQAKLGHLVHATRRGVIDRDLEIENDKNVETNAVAIDRDRRMAWYVRSRVLSRVDLSKPDLVPFVVAREVRGAIAPDLRGGVWVVTDSLVRRVDSIGTTIATITLPRR